MPDAVIPNWYKNDQEIVFFQKISFLDFDEFWCLNFIDISIEKYAGTNFANAETETF